MEALQRRQLDLAPNQKFYRGKVRDIYQVDDKIVSLASNRISAFDHILPKPIPHKGQVLNQLAAYFLQAVSDIVPTWLDSTPHPTVSLGKYCQPIRIEMVIRGYLAGHAWREYKVGKRVLCGEALPEGLQESDRLPHPIITPATKAESGHDEDISAQQILEQNIVDPSTWSQLCTYTHSLFQRGTEMAEKVGLILVDTKYEFGLYGDHIYLIDEIHTPDSSRYYYLDGYDDRQRANEPQIQLSKEFVREWLIEHGFQGLDGQTMPEMPEAFVQKVSQRYIELFEMLTSECFEKTAIISDSALAACIKKSLAIHSS